MPDTHKIPLSVIVPTTNPWPEIKNSLDSIYQQIEDTGSELIIAMSIDSALSENIFEKYKHLKTLLVPGADVFELRAKALMIAKGEIVAITEDHCTVTENWCAGIIKSHQDHPDFPAIAGAVLNGSPHTLLDRANYYSTFADFMPPILKDSVNRIPPAANITFKRSSITNSNIARGWLELNYSMKLFNERKYYFDESFSVYHIQSHGNAWNNSAIHFHNGRATTGIMLEHITKEHRRKKIKGLTTLPFRLSRETQQKMGRKSIPLYHKIGNIPPLLLITLSYTLGELIGLLFGPGKSADKLN